MYSLLNFFVHLAFIASNMYLHGMIEQLEHKCIICQKCASYMLLERDIDTSVYKDIAKYMFPGFTMLHCLQARYDF